MSFEITKRRYCDSSPSDKLKFLPKNLTKVHFIVKYIAATEFGFFLKQCFCFKEKSKTLLCAKCESFPSSTRDTLDHTDSKKEKKTYNFSKNEKKAT